MANAIVTVNEQDKAVIMGVLGGKMAQDIEFDKLDAQIEALANSSHELTDMERNNAAEFVKHFEERVVARIKDKSYKLSYFLNHLPANLESVHAMKTAIDDGDEVFTALFERQGMEDILDGYNKIKELIEKLDEYEEENKPEEGFYDDLTMTGAEIQQAKLEYAMKDGKYRLEYKKRENVVRKAMLELAKTCKKNAAYKDFVKVLKAQTKAADEAKAIVEEKADAARMAILISSSGIREALRALHAFSASI